MAELFVASDIHGFFTEFKEALDAAGFDERNEAHWLIVCGDCFDQGPQPLELLQYLQSLPRKVLIRGNHEDLLEQCCRQGFAGDLEQRVGTARTIMDIGDRPGRGSGFSKCCERTMALVQPLCESMVDCFETERFVFVHSWVPVATETDLPLVQLRGRSYAPLPNWRKAGAREWAQSRWLNPFEMARRGLQADKTIVCGHWHCSAGWAADEGRSEFGADARFDPYCGDGFIAIDACTVHSGKVNVLVLEDAFLEDGRHGSC